MKFSWKYDVNNDMLFIGLEVKATGWVGCGFAHNISAMKGYDVIMGRVRGGDHVSFTVSLLGEMTCWPHLTFLKMLPL